MRIAVLGLFNSGSSAVAGALHHLGVDMGAPYYKNHFEARDMAALLRFWWNEPRLVESAPREERVRVLRQWVEAREARGSRDIGLKHPLLCLSAADVETAWGRSVTYVWCYRELEDSIHGLERRRWFPDAAGMQHKLWASVTEFLGARNHVRVPFTDLLAHPRETVAAMASSLGLSPGNDRIETAAATIQLQQTGDKTKSEI
jgi:hypothetical protein